MIEFSKYAKVKDYYCICYFGLCDEYLLQLKLLKPSIEREFAGLKLAFGCRDDRTHIFGEHNVLKASDLKARRQDFAFISEIKFNGTTHPIEDFLKEADIKTYVVRPDLDETHTVRCVIITRGQYPTKPLEKRQIEVLKKIAKEDGYEPQLDTGIDGAGIVMGVESYALFDAASKGIKTKLIPTGFGTRLYLNMYPKGELLHT